MPALALQVPGKQFAISDITNCLANVYACSPGALIAGTWAALQYMGSEYVSMLPSVTSLYVAQLIARTGYC